MFYSDDQFPNFITIFFAWQISRAV